MLFRCRSSKGVSFAPNVATVMNSDRSNSGVGEAEGGASYRYGWMDVKGGWKILPNYNCMKLAIRNEHFKFMFLAPNPVTYTEMRFILCTWLW